MIKDIMSANEAVTPNSREMAVLREHFPACFTSDGAFDLERFKGFLSDKIAVTDEGYELKFLGKNYSRLLASLDTTTVIVPDEEHNAKPENANSQNVYISGDNLDGLKHLLKSYEKKIKCIYIDPPYNTGKDDFVYNDTFSFTKEALSERLSISIEQAERILDLTKRGASSHSAWMMFMYPRLMLAKDLLAPNGVIFISIDDNEQANLKLLCDDIFGEDNLVGTIVWKNVTDNNPTNITVEHEYVLCFARSKAELEPVWKSSLSELKSKMLDIEKDLIGKYGYDLERLQNEYSSWYSKNKTQLGKLEGYKFIDCGGIYAGSRSVHNPGKNGYFYDVIHPVTHKPCTPPLMGYRFPLESMNALIEQDKIIYGEDETKIIELKQYLHEYADKFSSVVNLDGRSGANTIRTLFDNKNVFKNPKTTSLIEHILSYCVSPEDIVVDFFSGSSTTVHAIMNMNVTDNQNRHYIAIQLQEKTKPKSDAEKAGFKTIDQIGMQRIIRAAAKLREENPETTADLGFKHFTLVEPPADALDKMEVFEPIANDSMYIQNTVGDDFSSGTILTTWLVRDGYGFTAPVQAVDFGGYTGYWMDKHLYLIDEKIPNSAVESLTQKYENDKSFNPEHIVLFGYNFTFTEIDTLQINLKRLSKLEGAKTIQFDVRY